MEHTKYFYIQRLDPPYGGYGVASQGNPFSFGGGYPNGGLSKEAFALVSQCWNYDYMGSAEFEFGALPKSWKRIQDKSDNYITGSCEVKAIGNDYSQPKKTVRNTQNATVWYFCHKDDEAELKEWLAKFANEVKHDFSSKERIGFGDAILRPDKRRTRGWHDIENDYLFFTDKEMFDTMCRVLEIEQTK